MSIDIERGIGSPQQSISLGDAAALELTGDMTVEAWVKIESDPGSWPTIANKANDNGWRILISGTTKPEFAVAGVYIQGATTLSTATWYHLAGVRTSNTIYVYINGVQDGTTTGTPSFSYSTEVACIGNRTDQDRSFDGIISEVRVWNVARSVAQLKANMYRRLTGQETGLVGYWRLDGDARDLSGNGNHGTLAGSTLPSWVPEPPITYPHGAIYVRVVSADATVNAAIALATAGGYISTPTIQVPAVLATATADGYAATPTLQVPGALATATAGGYISTPTVQVPAAIATATAGGYVGEIQIVIPAALATATAGGYAASLITDVILAAAQALATAGGYTAEIQVIVPAAQALATAGGYTATPTIEVPAALATATAGGYAASLTIQVLAALASATAEALVAVPGVSVVAVVATATAGGLVVTIAIYPKGFYSTGLYVDTVYKTGLHADTIYKRGLHVDTVYLTGTFP